MSRYRVLFVAVAVIAVALAIVARRPRQAHAPVAAVTAVPSVDLTVSFSDGSADPAAGSVPKDHRVRLTLVNRGHRPAVIDLAGYEDRLPPVTLAPGDTWRGEFLADRPGEDFAWRMDGAPCGRLAVTGPHLVDGHR